MIGLVCSWLASWLMVAPPPAPRDPAGQTLATAESGDESSYGQALVAVREATIATNIDPRGSASELALALDELLAHAPALAADPSGRELHLMGSLTLARAALERGARGRAAMIVDQLLTGLLLTDELDELDGDKLGPRLEALILERSAAAPLAELARVHVECSAACQVYIDGRAVAPRLAHDPGAPVTPGVHAIWIEAEGQAPLRTQLEVLALGEVHELHYGAAEPPAPRIERDAGPADARPSPVLASPRLAPRWTEISLGALGVAGVGVGAALVAIHGRCIANPSTVPGPCPQLHDTRAAGITTITLGASALLTSTILLAIDEKRRTKARRQ